MYLVTIGPINAFDEKEIFFYLSTRCQSPIRIQESETRLYENIIVLNKDAFDPLRFLRLFSPDAKDVRGQGIGVSFDGKFEGILNGDESTLQQSVNHFALVDHFL